MDRPSPRALTPAAAGAVVGVVFDVGNVLLQWNPRFLMRKLLPDDAAVEHFLREICPPTWNLEQDRGRPWAEGVRIQAARHPAYAGLIQTWNERWHETLPGPVAGMPELVAELAGAGVPLHILSNFSAEKFAETRQRYAPLFAHFDQIVISGEVGFVKPETQIFTHLLARTAERPHELAFVDDVADYAHAATRLGIHGIGFRDEPTLRRELIGLGLPLRPR